MQFLNEHKLILYALILFGKILGSMIGVLWLIFVNRGEKLKAAVVSLFEVGMWLLVAGSVLINFQEDLIKCLMYVIGTGIGMYLGLMLEEHLALGLGSIQVIISSDNSSNTITAQELADNLRQNDFAVTVLDGKGISGKREILVMHVRRKRIKKALSIIRKDLKDAMITVSDVMMIRGGYLNK